MAFVEVNDDDLRRFTPAVPGPSAALVAAAEATRPLTRDERTAARRRLRAGAEGDPLLRPGSQYRFVFPEPESLQLVEVAKELDELDAREAAAATAKDAADFEAAFGELQCTQEPMLRRRQAELRALSDHLERVVDNAGAITAALQKPFAGRALPVEPDHQT